MRKNIKFIETAEKLNYFDSIWTISCLLKREKARSAFSETLEIIKLEENKAKKRLAKKKVKGKKNNEESGRKLSSWLQHS